MTLEQMKQKVFSMIEEYSESAENLTEDEDLALKMNSVINQIQNELSRLKKIPAYEKLNVREGQIIEFQDIDNEIYQINTIQGVDADIIDNTVIAREDGEMTVYYYKYPKQIDEETDDDYVFELSNDILEIMPYGVAGDLLKSDVSSQFGQIYSARYQELKQQLDSRYSLNMIYIDGGVEC